MQFLDREHEERFYNLFQRTGIRASDGERMVLLYLLSSFDGIYSKADLVYDFKTNRIKFYRVAAIMRRIIVIFTLGFQARKRY